MSELASSRAIDEVLSSIWNVEMIEYSSLHTNYVGGIKFEEQIFLDYDDEQNGIKMLFSNKKMSKRRLKAKVCPKCGLVELYVDLASNE